MLKISINYLQNIFMNFLYLALATGFDHFMGIALWEKVTFGKPTEQKF